MSDGYETRQECIIAALDEMKEGDTLFVHEKGCLLALTDTCSCEPETWTY